VAHRRDDPGGLFGGRPAEVGVDARDQPVVPGEELGVVVEAAVDADVELRAVEQADVPRALLEARSSRRWRSISSREMPLMDRSSAWSVMAR
jgi:hypothetical protein